MGDAAVVVSLRWGVLVRVLRGIYAFRDVKGSMTYIILAFCKYFRIGSMMYFEMKAHLADCGSWVCHEVPSVGFFKDKGHEIQKLIEKTAAKIENSCCLMRFC